MRLHTQITLTSAKYGFRDNYYRDFVQATTASESLSMSVSISIDIVFSRNPHHSKASECVSREL